MRMPTIEEVAAHEAAHPCREIGDTERIVGLWMCFHGRTVSLRGLRVVAPGELVHVSSADPFEAIFGSEATEQHAAFASDSDNDCPQMWMPIELCAWARDAEWTRLMANGQPAGAS